MNTQMTWLVGPFTILFLVVACGTNEEDTSITSVPLDYYEISKGKGLVYDGNGNEIEVSSEREGGGIRAWDEDGNEYIVVERFD